MSTFPSRPYQTETDLHAMLDLLIEGRARTDDWHYPHIGEFLFGFFMIACHLDPQEQIRFWHDGERLIGFALLGEDPSFDFHLLPDYEWQGIETEARDWAESKLSELRRLDPQRWNDPLVSGARQDNTRRQTFLEQHGFQPGGQFPEVNMIRSLDEPLPEIAIPAGWQIRAVADDAAELTSRADIQRQVWLPWPVGKVTDDNYRYFMHLPAYQRDLDIVAAAPDGTLAAYANGWLDNRNQIGDLGPVGALPAYRRQGLTRAVLIECLRRMQSCGMQRVCISTGVSNTPAIRLYESIGFKIVNRYLEYLKSG